MDWFHCNSCFKQPKTREDKFDLELTSCGHLLCRSCRQKGNNTCTVCRKPSSFLQLEKQLPPQVEPYLLDPSTTLKKSVQTLKQVLSFQQDNKMKLYNHRLKVLEAHLRQKEGKLEELKKEHIELRRRVAAQQRPKSSLSPSVGRCSSSSQSSVMQSTPISQLSHARPFALSHHPRSTSSQRNTYSASHSVDRQFTLQAPQSLGMRQITLQTPQSLGMRGGGSPMQH